VPEKAGGKKAERKNAKFIKGRINFFHFFEKYAGDEL
jgi:hypothetical protein